uniref:ABTB2/3 histone-like domain-containing protein n=1 Tax=Eptatretus burgeri TaxID=7764 RepID=A0A8C4QUK0_EPTBU
MPGDREHKQRVGGDGAEIEDQEHIEIWSHHQTLPPNHLHSSQTSIFEPFQLPKLSYLPWSRAEVIRALEGTGKAHSQKIVHQLAKLAHRPLIRLTYEAGRLASMFSCCSEEEIRGAVTLVLSPGLVKRCLAAISRALSLFLMSTGEQRRRDKTSRCGLLALSPGHFFRWMQDSIPGCRLTERAAVALAACMEVLLAELQRQGEPRGTGPIWPLIQSFEYLITEQGLNGELVLPDDWMALGEDGRWKGKLKDVDQNGAGELAEYRSVQQACRTTCVASKAELGALLAQVSRLVAQIMPGPSGRMCDHPTWRPAALHALYHHLYCARAHVLQPPVVSLTQEIPLALRPPLWRWVWIAVCHATCRRAASVEAGDVAQASRLLLPGHSCPPARLEYERNGYFIVNWQ